MGFLGLGKKTLDISQSAYDQILEHARDAYPHECCGILVGSTMQGTKVMYVHRAENTNKERANDRYKIDPREFNMIDREARMQSLDILGFYHSHPDHPDKPSSTDREDGQPGYSYIIVSVNKGKDTSIKCWSFEEENEPFKEIKIKII